VILLLEEVQEKYEHELKEKEDALRR